MPKFKITLDSPISVTGDVIQYWEWCGHGVLPLNISPQSPRGHRCDKCACDVWPGHCDQAIVAGNYKRIYSSLAHMDYNSYKNWKYIEQFGPINEEAGSVKVK